MSLSQSRALSNVHPWLAERVRFLGQAIDFWGGSQIYLSGTRSREEQQFLFDRRGRRPVARPGCSQHQYGFAVDLSWLPIFNFSLNLQLTARETADVMIDLGNQVGLVTVANDRGHFQVFPGSEFKTWAVGSGFCDPTPAPPISTFTPPRTDFVFRTCGEGADSVRQGLFGLECVFRGD